jgi:hypothetical protein
MKKATYLGYMFETGVDIPHLQICDSNQLSHVSGYALARFGWGWGLAVLSRGPSKPLNIDQARPYSNIHVPTESLCSLKRNSTHSFMGLHTRTYLIPKSLHGITELTWFKKLADVSVSHAWTGHTTELARLLGPLYSENEKLLRCKDLHLCTFTQRQQQMPSGNQT